jgi:hypothetical protein
MPQNQNLCVSDKQLGYGRAVCFFGRNKTWIPAFAGMTRKDSSLRSELQKRGFSVLAEDDGKKISRAALLLGT